MLKDTVRRMYYVKCQILFLYAFNKNVHARYENTYFSFYTKMYEKVFKP